MQSSTKEGPNKRQRSVSRSPSPRGSASPSWGRSSFRKRRSATGDDHTQRTQRSIPAFLNKLYSMVDDDSTNNLIRWSDAGNTFIVEQHELFSKTVLPRFYKHNTFSSFVRQLNMYDFHKVPHLQQGVLVADSEHELWEFSHPNFQKDRYDLLHLVVRKRIRSSNDPPPQPSSAAQSPQANQPYALSNSALQQSSMDQQHRQHQPLLLEQSLGGASSTLGHPRLNALGDTPMELEHVRLGSLVKDISTIRHHQHAISADLQHLHNDNEILWRETLMAREKHQRHQQVIERILLFLTSVFSTDGFSAASPKGMPFALGNLDSAANPSSKLIEEAVKLAGISTTSLQQSYFGEASKPDGPASPSFGHPISPMAHRSPQPQQPQHTSYQQSPLRNPTQQQLGPQQSNQDQGQSQEKGKFANRTDQPVMYSPLAAYSSYGQQQQQHQEKGPMEMISTVDGDPSTADNDTLQHHHPYSGITTLSDISSSESGGADITRISGLAESLHTATRSAEAISQDIDDLQISIESLAATMGLDANGVEDFDGYLDEFTDNYSNMISLATRNDKMQLFELAGGESTHYDNNDNNNQARPSQHHHHHHQQEMTNDRSTLMDPAYSTLPPSSNNGM